METMYLPAVTIHLKVRYHHSCVLATMYCIIKSKNYPIFGFCQIYLISCQSKDKIYQILQCISTQLRMMVSNHQLLLTSTWFPSCFLTLIAVINPYSLFKFIFLKLLLYVCVYFLQFIHIQFVTFELNYSKMVQRSLCVNLDCMVSMYVIMHFIRAWYDTYIVASCKHT